MTEITTAVGRDTWANQSKPNRNYSSTVSVGVDGSSGAARQGFVHPALSAPILLGRTILAAELVGRVRVMGGDQTVTVAPITSPWTVGGVDWNHRPTVGTPTASVFVDDATPEGATVTWDITDIIQAVADGAAWRGLRMTSNGAVGMWFESFNSGNPSWEISISISEAPDQPENLRPDGGAVGSQKPILAWDADGLIPQDAFRVQIYSSEADATADFDSGWVTSPVPEYDLSATAYTPLATPWWTVQTRSADGSLSDVSDRASFTYAAKRTVVMDTPTGGVIGDPTPVVAAHLSAGTLTMWRGMVTAADRSDVRFDTGIETGACSFTVPWRNARGERVLRDEKPGWLQVRMWDEVDRAAAVGDPAYAEVWVPLSWDDDVVPAPTALTVTPAATGDARMVWQWSDTSTAEAYLLQVDGVTVVRIEGADLTPSAGHYTYTDHGEVPPLRPCNLAVRAVNDSGDRSPAAADMAGEHTHIAEGVWFIPDDGDPVVLNGTAVESIRREDYTATYQMQDGSTVDIIYGRPGLTGDLELSVSGEDAFDQLDAFDALTPDDTTIPRGQLVWGSRSIRARLRSPHHVPDPQILQGNKLHIVRFGFVQED